jgi:hypothetical protein
MAITRDSTQDLDQIGKRVRILTGIESTEIDDTDLSELITMASEWFETQSGLTYTVNTEDAYDNAVVFYASYLGSIAQNGMGVENLKIGDIFIQYTDDEPYIKFLKMAQDALNSQIATSVKRTTYNADASKGSVDWKKNIDGSSNTLNVRQSPRNISRSGELERTGHRITGSCTFYMPSLSYIKALPEFSETTQFSELETYDKLLDIERIIHNPDDVAEGSRQTATFSFSSTTAGYEVDRVQFKIKTSGVLDYIQLNGNISGSSAYLRWDGNLSLSSSEFITIDVPVRNIEDGDTTLIYKDGTGSTFTASLNNSFDTDKLRGDSGNELSSLVVQLTSSSTVELKEIYLYKSAEWRVDTIKDFRDEYMEVGAVRVRGDRTSRRRAYG